MDVGIEKCAMLVMEKGKIVKSVGIELPDGKVIESLQEGESYKYLGIFEVDKFLEEKMKLNVWKEYIRRLKKVLKSKLNGDLHPKSNVDRLYILRKERGRGLKSIEDCVELAIRGLEVYTHGSEERLIQAARGDNIDGLEAASVLKRSKNKKRLEDWEEKVLHGQYLRQTKEVRSDQCWAWLQNGDLKRETESLIAAAQNQSIRTNLVKAKIGKNQGDSLCRMCGKVDESIDHILVVVVNLHRRSLVID